nr:ABC-three component system middle component 2 [Bradyrhizobium ottawaense]
MGLGVGLPVDPLDRLAQFSPEEFERFTLEWASGYLASKIPDVHEVQQRGGAGDKGRDIVVWLDPPSSKSRRWSLYQCKHYDTKLGTGVAAAEIGKVLYYTFTGDYSSPQEYWFVTHRGVTSDFQDYVDQPEALRTYILAGWNDRCATKITSKQTIALSAALKAHIQGFDFSIFRVKQPLTLIDEHAQTRFHLTVFGAPLIERPPPPTPPSMVAASESEYIEQLYQVIGADLGKRVTAVADFASAEKHSSLFDRSRITFYRGTEFLVKRDVMSIGLNEMFSRELLDKTFDTAGILYRSTKLTTAFVSLLKSEYANSLRDRADWVVMRFGDMKDTELSAYMTASIGKWGAEFERLTAINELEL